MVLDIINWILGIAEVRIYYEFVSNLTDRNVQNHRTYFGICSIVIGSLVAYNRIMSHLLVSWAMILLQVILVWLTLGLKESKYVVQKLSFLLFVNINFSLMQIMVMYGIMSIFPQSSVTEIYHFGFWSVLICVLPVILLYVLTKIIENIQTNSDIDSYSFSSIFFMLGLLGLLLIMNCQVQIVHLGRQESIVNFIFVICWLVFCVIIIFFSIRVTENTIEKVALEINNQFLKEKYDEISNMYYNYVTAAHDMKNHLIILENYCQNEKYENALEYIRKIKGPVSKIKKYISTSNEIIDIILNYKLSIAEQNGITIKIQTEQINNCGIESDDLCAILANLIDNAINACCDVGEDKERWINIIIKRQGHTMVISISNSYYTLTKKRNKSKDSLHGYGKQSVRQKVQKYNGKYFWKQNEDMYEAIVTFDNLGG